MRQRRCSFEQQKTVVRRRRKKAPTTRLFNEMFVVFGGFKTEQGKLESVLATGFAVATAGITPGLRENRHDLVGKVHRRGGIEAFDGHRQSSGQRFLTFCGDRGFAS